MRKFSLYIFVASVGLLLALFCNAAILVAETNRPKMIINAEVLVQEDIIHLGDIAELSDTEGSEKLVHKLQVIPLGKAPLPAKEERIHGSDVLEQISRQGIALDAIGYSIPHTIQVRRDGRLLERSEVVKVLQEEFASSEDLDMVVHDVVWDKTYVIPNGKTYIGVEKLGDTTAGKMPLRVSVFVNDSQVTQFLATAKVDDWRSVPVLTERVRRGRLIESSQLKLVRLNMGDRPADTISDISEVIGKKAKRTLAAGSTIRKRSIVIPPVITRGALVTAKLQLGVLQATTTGIALEDGLDGSVIKIRNSESRKIIKGKVINAEVVEVMP
jgi:flagella basal body P-ring formation protein FlgA